MDIIILSIFIITLLIILFSIITIVINKLLIKNDEFVINYNILLNTIEVYKETILSGKINMLSSEYDLNQKSKTNSLVAFEKEKNRIISETVKDIMKNYLSKKCFKYLIKMYGIDGLSLLILTHLKR